ncbi:MAG: DUF4239 domain-containing protein [Deltaproteobacteria bacterium]|nr:DUF4239 domain-containing protein [Deltaproteobacteria bacterium]
MFFLVFSTILATSLLLTGLLYFMRRRFAAAGLAIEHLHPAVFSLFTTIYAFFLGFSIVTLWSAFLSAQANVTREADTLLMAYRLSENLPNSEEFRRTLTDYVQSVVNDEWPAMAKDYNMNQKTQDIWDKLWDNLIPLKPADKADNDIYLEIANFLSQASRHRLSRALLTRGNLYPLVWVIIIFGFLTMLYGVYYNHMQQNPVRLCFDFMLIFVVLSCIYFIYDIDTPFSGYVLVNPDSFKFILARMPALQ